MKVKPIPSSWLERDGRRLDCNPYMSGALEAKVLLEGLKAKKEPLAKLTAGYKGGIYNGPQFKRNYVDSPDHGVQFLTGGDVLGADTSRLPLLSRRDAHSPKLSYLRLEPGMTIISCSGAIGRMGYVRDDMAGVWSSQDVMKVVPNAEEIPPGYLYAYLSSKFGVPLVVGGTYGAIIQHIEPEHIANLPVPRLGKTVEQTAHELIANAAKLRADSSGLLEKAKVETSKAWGIDPALRLRTKHHPDVNVVLASTLARTARFDAFFYGAAASSSDAVIAEISKRHPIRRIGDANVSTMVFETTRFGRVSVEDPAFGVPFLSIADMMKGDPKSDSYISRKQAAQVNAIVHSGWLILPRVGQLQGVFGTVSYVPRHLDGVAVSDNNIRIVPVGEDEGAYLWAALSTDLLYQQIIRRACGTSIPYIDSKRVADIPVPWPPEATRLKIADLVKTAMEMRTKASHQEGEAVRLVEQAIEKGAVN
jgi:type I restriction enzyme S subunit